MKLGRLAAFVLTLAMLSASAINAQQAPAGAPYTPTAGDKDLRATIFNWMWHQGMLKGTDERDMVATLEYQSKAGTIQVDKNSFVGLPIPVAGGLIAAIIHFNPTPIVGYGPERARIYSGLLMLLVGLLSLMMVSTLRFSSFKAVGTGSRSMRTIILVLAIGGLIVLYSQYVLLGLVLAYIFYGLISRVLGMFWRRGEAADSQIETNPVTGSSSH